MSRTCNNQSNIIQLYRNKNKISYTQNWFANYQHHINLTLRFVLFDSYLVEQLYTGMPIKILPLTFRIHQSPYFDKMLIFSLDCKHWIEKKILYKILLRWQKKCNEKKKTIYIRFNCLAVCLICINFLLNLNIRFSQLRTGHFNTFFKLLSYRHKIFGGTFTHQTKIDSFACISKWNQFKLFRWPIFIHNFYTWFTGTIFIDDVIVGNVLEFSKYLYSNENC